MVAPLGLAATINQCLNQAVLGWLEVECNQSRASIPSMRSGAPNTPLWKLEASFKCRSCRKGRYAPPVHMIRLTPKREIAPYKWVHPDEDR